MNRPVLPPIEVMPKDITPYRRGNTGIDYVHHINSGKPGPLVALVGLTHGNEFCGMTAVTWLLDQGFMPLHGSLILALANVDAYHSFDAERPLVSRFIDRDMNRVWNDALLDSDEDGVELRRARALRPILSSVDALLDIHSTTYAVPDMLIYQDLPKANALASRIRAPLHHLTSRGGLHSGGLLKEYGAFSDPTRPNAALVVECGQHFAAASGEVAKGTAIRFLDAFGMVSADLAAAHLGEQGNLKRYMITDVLLAESDDFKFSQPFVGFEELAAGELIARDAGREIRAPYERCAIIMPKAEPQKGKEVMTLAQRLD